MVTDPYRIVNSRLLARRLPVPPNSDPETRPAAETPVDLLAPLVPEVVLPVSIERLQAAVAQHARAHDTLMRLREIQFQYTPSYIEPLTALRWIEREGRSLD
jgi:hypothetical protein